MASLLALSPRAFGHGRLRLETGGEYDSNATRTAPRPEDSTALPRLASWLLRTSADFSYATALSARHGFAFHQILGAKLFLTNDAGRFENVFTTSTAFTFTSRLSSRWAGDTRLHYYDAFQTESPTQRDFRTGSLVPRLHLSLWPSTRLALSLGYRAFQYKPDTTQSNWGPLAGMQLSWRWLGGELGLEHEWELGLSYQFQHRTFDGPNLIASNGTTQGAVPVEQPGTTHLDRFHFGEAYAQYTGFLLLGLSYGIQWNDSTSYGYGFLRHLLTLRLATTLPLELTSALRVGLQVLSLAEQLNFDPLRPESIEQENRTFVEATLSRSIGGPLEVLVRYAFYTSTLGASGLPAYSRQVIFLGFQCDLER